MLAIPKRAESFGSASVFFTGDKTQCRTVDTVAHTVRRIGIVLKHMIQVWVSDPVGADVLCRLLAAEYLFQVVEVDRRMDGTAE